MSGPSHSSNAMILWVPQRDEHTQAVTARKASEKIELSSTFTLPQIEINEVMRFILFRRPNFVIPPTPHTPPAKPASICNLGEEGREDGDIQHEVGPTEKMEAIDEDDELDFSVCEEVHGDAYMDVDETEQGGFRNKRRGEEEFDDDVFAPIAKKRKDKYVEHVDIQWRVGKTPGHQGSHRKDLEKMNVEGSIGEKRSISQSINETVAKVLKKPFRPPKIVLARAQSKPLARPASPSPPPERPTASYQTPESPRSLPTRLRHRLLPSLVSTPEILQNSSPTLEPYEHSNYTSDLSSTPSIFRSHRISNKTKLGKPFKTPNRLPESENHLQTPSSTIFSRSGAPSPSSFPSRKSTHTPGNTLSRSTQPSAPVQTDRIVISHLELRAQHLREALNHHKNPGNGSELLELTRQWLAAGREITERMFQLVPQPDPNTDNDTHGGHGQGRSYYGDMGGMSKSMELSRSDREYLDTLPRNEDGDAVDGEGNLLIGDPPNREDMSAMIREEVALAKGRKGLSGSDRGVSRHTQDSDGDVIMGDSDRSANNTLDPTRWDHGILLSKLGIDPALLGWDPRAEDWNELDEF